MSYQEILDLLTLLGEPPLGFVPLARESLLQLGALAREPLLQLGALGRESPFEIVALLLHLLQSGGVLVPQLLLAARTRFRGLFRRAVPLGDRLLELCDAGVPLCQLGHTLLELLAHLRLQPA